MNENDNTLAENLVDELQAADLLEEILVAIRYRFREAWRETVPADHAVPRADALAAIKDAMLHALEKEHRIIDIARQLGRHPEDVRQRARELGVEPVPPPEPDPRVELLCDCGFIVRYVDEEDRLARWTEHYTAPASPCYDEAFAARMSQFPTREEYEVMLRAKTPH